MDGSLTTEYLADCRKEFSSNDKNLLALNVASTKDPVEVALKRTCIETSNHVFSHKTEEYKPVTNQGSSGRCWIFASLNAMRIPFMKANEIDEFEFSQGHLFFWDKIERSNYFLNAIAETYRRNPKADVGSRLGSFLLSQPISDGGQWDMVVNLIEKHGLMPKKCYPETWSCTSSMRMNGVLKTKLREYAHAIHKLIDGGAGDEAVRKLIQSQMKTIFRIVGICLGVPPTEFTWEYYDKSKKYQKVGPLTPLEFYQQRVKPHFDAESKVCIVTDPRPENPTGATYTVDCLGNVVGGRKTLYNNQPVDVLAKIAAKSIKAGEPVWFGCEVGKHMARNKGILDLDAHDYNLVFGTDINKELTKAERLIYGDTAMNHAMVLTGVHLDETNVTNGDGGSGGELVGEPTKWRIENSWGEDKNEKGYIVMTTRWFEEFVFEIVVDKKFCPQEVLDVMEKEPKMLPAWDPMGALARR